MAEPPRPLSRAEREAHRALLEDALRDLAAGDDPERAANEVMRALDHYIEASTASHVPAPREPPVTDFARRHGGGEGRWLGWLVVGGAVVATVVVAIALSGGWPVAIAVIAIWVLALAALLST